MSLGLILEQYPDEVIKFVTDPRTGIQRRSKWPPSIAEIVEACDECATNIKRRERFTNWGKNNVDAFGNIVAQIEGPPPAKKMTKEEMEAKYGKGYGLTDPKEAPPPLTREEITSAWAATIKQYQSDPSLIDRLKNAKEA